MQIRVLPLAMAGILLGACAASPPQPQPVIGAVAPASVAATGDKPGYVSDPRVVAADRRAREMGYHMEMRHDQQFYCRTVAPIGSRLTQKECLTADGMVQAVQMAEENKVAQKQQSNCQGAGCTFN
jgi:hypothetical protein